MSKSSNYTRLARSFVKTFPVFNQILSQIVFWILAYILLAILSHLVLLTADPGSEASLRANLVIALFFGFFYGVASGFVAQFFEKQISDYYVKKYGQAPQFKAGLHMGMVTAVEVGNIKRDIAYHGDTLNTTARIQGVCNQYNETFLTSMYVLENTGIGEHFKTASIGMVGLKGKGNPIEIASIKLK